MKKKKNECLMNKFWREYEEADILDRPDLLIGVEKHIRSAIEVEKVLDTKHLKFTLQTYFDDLLEYVYCKEFEK